jgi:hypothetical protein
MIPCKPKFDTRTREDITYYSTDYLRRLYAEREGELIKLRDSNISRDELKAEILRRDRRASAQFWIKFSITLIGALAAIVAAVEGWRTP